MKMEMLPTVGAKLLAHVLFPTTRESFWDEGSIK